MMGSPNNEITKILRQDWGLYVCLGFSTRPLQSASGNYDQRHFYDFARNEWQRALTERRAPAHSQKHSQPRATAGKNNRFAGKQHAKQWQTREPPAAVAGVPDLRAAFDQPPSHERSKRIRQ
jgi:hypothetical protein